MIVHPQAVPRELPNVVDLLVPELQRKAEPAASAARARPPPLAGEGGEGAPLAPGARRSPLSLPRSRGRGRKSRNTFSPAGICYYFLAASYG
jgi:hypothetical protein